MKALLPITALLPCFAQTPVISAVFNAATLQPGIAPVSLFTIFGSGLATTGASASTAWPSQLGGSYVEICSSAKCDSSILAGLLYVSPSQINAYTPVAISYVKVVAAGFGSTVFPVIPGMGASGSVASPDLLAPGLFTEGSDTPVDPNWSLVAHFQPNGTPLPKPLRGAVTDQSGHLITSNNPARVGPAYTLWLTGLNAADYQQLGYPRSLSLPLMDVPIPGFKFAVARDTTVLYVG